MSGMQFLYKNSNFKNSGFNENHKFSSDFFLDNLNNIFQQQKQPSKKKPSDDEVSINRKFSQHPRYISEDSLTSTSIEVVERPIFKKKPNPLKTKKESIKKTNSFLESTEYEKLLMEVTPLFGSDNYVIHPSGNLSETSISQLSVDKVEVAAKNHFNQTDAKKQERAYLKLNSVLVKTSTSLQDIRNLVESGILPVESIEDQVRREKRTMGFFTRFARNYLYQIGRQINVMRNLTRRESVTSVMISQKMFNIGQLVLQALQSYQYHVQSTIVCNAHSKFQQLITFIEDFCVIVKKVRNVNGINVMIAMIDDIENGCKCLMPLIQMHLIKKPNEIERTNNIPNAPSSSIIHLTKSHASSGLPFQKKHTLENRLKMYTAAFKRNPNAWKKNTVVLAKQRFSKIQVKANLPTIAPTLTEDPITINAPPSNIGKVIVEKRSSQMTSCVNQLIIDDDIETMVQLHQNKPGSLLTMAKDEINNKLEPLLRNLLTEMTKQHKDELVDGMVDSDTLDKLRGLMEQMKLFTIDDNNDDLTEQMTDTAVVQKSVTITGGRNVKLICIKDKSCFENDTIAPQENTHEIDTGLQEPARSPVLKHLPKKYTVNVIQYKLQFHTYTKHNHMYKKTNTIQPWLLTNKISDKLLRYVLTSVLDEMRLNQVADTVFTSEFVLF